MKVKDNMNILSLIPLVGQVVDKMFPGDSDDVKRKRLEIELELTKALVSADLGQMKINEIDAGSASLYKSGWRPAFGWLGVVAITGTTLTPLISYGLELQGLPPLPTVDVSLLTAIVTGMLGMGGFRTYEKFKGVTK